MIFRVVPNDGRNIPLIVGLILMVKRCKTVHMYENVSPGNDIFSMDATLLPPQVISLWASESEVISSNKVGVN